MTQREQLRDVLRAVVGRGARPSFIAHWVGRLQTTLGETQNPPPEGGNDGSVDEGTFNDYRALEKALVALERALHVLLAREGRED